METNNALKVFLLIRFFIIHGQIFLAPPCFLRVIRESKNIILSSLSFTSS